MLYTLCLRMFFCVPTYAYILPNGSLHSINNQCIVSASTWFYWQHKESICTLCKPVYGKQRFRIFPMPIHTFRTHTVNPHISVPLFIQNQKWLFYYSILHRSVCFIRVFQLSSAPKSQWWKFQSQKSLMQNIFVVLIIDRIFLQN